MPSGRSLALAGFFIVLWPSFNVLFVAVVQQQIGMLNTDALGGMALRLYGAFTIAFGIVLLAQRLWPVRFAADRFWPQLLLHLAAIAAGASMMEPRLAATDFGNVPQPTVVPLVLTLFQVTLYVSIKTLIIQRDRHLSTELNLQRAQINMLRSQSNPHFLFNTLNLLAAEIGRDPDNAREIVYDLADLLRDSMQAAEREFITLREELRLAELYLTLQVKRFPQRLAFTFDIEPGCESLPVPSLLLQPVVENIVKHVVSPSSALTKISVSATISDGLLVIAVSDNGPAIDTATITPRGGLRIVRETLALHHHGRAQANFASGEGGTTITLTLPAEPVADARVHEH